MKTFIKTIILFSITAVLFSGCAHTPTKEELQPYVNKIKSQHRYDYSGMTIREIVALSDEEFDLLTASLHVAKEVYPTIDIETYINKVEDLSAELDYRLQGKNSYKQKISTISDMIWEKGYIAYKPFWETYDQTRFRDLWYYEYSNLPLLIDTKKGNCVAFSIFYLALAKRVGVPLYGVVIPGHIFVRYDDGKNKQNIEPLDNGFCYSNEKYKDTAHLTAELCADGQYYLHKLTDKEVFGTLLLNLSSMANDKNDTIRTIRYMNTAIKANTRDPGIMTSAGIVHLKFNNIENSLYYFDKVLEINPYSIVVLSQKALIMRSFGELEESDKLFRKTLPLIPVHATEWFNKGVAYFYLKDFTKAMECFNTSLDHEDKLPAVWYYMAGTYAMMDKKDNSLSCLRTAIEMDPVFKIHAKQDQFFQPFKDDELFMELID